MFHEDKMFQRTCCWRLPILGQSEWSNRTVILGGGYYLCGWATVKKRLREKMANIMKARKLGRFLNFSSLLLFHLVCHLMISKCLQPRSRGLYGTMSLVLHCEETSIFLMTSISDFWQSTLVLQAFNMLIFFSQVLWVIFFSQVLLSTAYVWVWVKPAYA